MKILNFLNLSYEFYIAFFFPYFIIYILKCLGISMIFDKLFLEKSNKAWIPIYNQYTLYKNLNISWNFYLNILVISVTYYIIENTNFYIILLFTFIYFIIMNIRIQTLVFKNIDDIVEMNVKIYNKHNYKYNIGKTKDYKDEYKTTLTLLSSLFPSICFVIDGIIAKPKDRVGNKYRNNGINVYL